MALRNSLLLSRPRLPNRAGVSIPQAVMALRNSDFRSLKTRGCFIGRFNTASSNGSAQSMTKIYGLNDKYQMGFNNASSNGSAQYGTDQFSIKLERCKVSIPQAVMALRNI